MKLPFTTQQFLEVFKTYNHAIWPLQLVFILLAVFTVFIVIWKPIISGKIIPVILALLWIWMGGVYHLLFFSTINEAANIFGLLFILQGILFLRYGLITSQTFELKKDLYGIAAAILIIYALFIYPVIGYYPGMLIHIPQHSGFLVLQQFLHLGYLFYQNKDCHFIC